MTHCIAALSANAGILLAWNGYKIWVDALHDEPTGGFSSVSPAIWTQMQVSSSFSPPDLLCFTHCHADHYSRRLAMEAKMLWPDVKAFLPEREFDWQFLLSGDEMKVSCGGLTIRFLRLPHESAAYAAVPHYGLLISDGTFRVLIAGDCEVASPLLARRLNNVPVDLAILDFPWLTLRKGRQFVETVLRPSHLLICHLPFPENDVNGYADAVRRAMKLSELPDIRILSHPLQTETI